VNDTAFEEFHFTTPLRSGKRLKTDVFLRRSTPDTRGVACTFQEHFVKAGVSSNTRLDAAKRGTAKRGLDMLGWALTFLIVALIAAVLGFGGIAGVAIEAAKIVFFVAIVLFAISAVVALFRGRSPRLP
jgi:uncharacterized membrane protein YtjA (UPF0391 family)